MEQPTRLTTKAQHGFLQNYLQDQTGDESRVLGLLLLCARAYVTADYGILSKAAPLRPEGWRLLETKALEMRIVPIVHAAAHVDESPIPAEVGGNLERIVKANLLNNKYLLREGHRLLGVLETQGILAVPFKGLWLAWLLYGNLSMRISGDIDILVRKRDFNAARASIIEQGYREHLSEVLPRAKRQTSLESRDGRSKIDLHWSVFTRRFHTSTEEDCLYESLQVTEIEGIRHRTFSTPANLNIICIQGSKDCWPDLGRVCDAAMCLGQCGHGDWNDAVSLAHGLGTYRALLLGTRLAHEVTGVPLPSGAAADIQKEPVLDSLVDQVARGYAGLTTWSAPLLKKHWFYNRLATTRVHRARVTWHFLPYYFRKARDVSESDQRVISLPKQLEFLYFIVRFGRLGGFVTRSATNKIMAKLTGKGVTDGSSPEPNPPTEHSEQKQRNARSPR